ncbi:INO80 complex subunit Ies4-domain-containing protein [Lipomyces chichibuensis]|uniref:INO80 complex subunit Ies4-domain-containing protein n=1 Tax=Lipomyces chichibuensis TaxID=1546026 RepID=UPI003343B945
MSRQSRSVVLKLNPQLLAQQEQAMAASASLSIASSPLPPSSPLAPPTPPPGIASDLGTRVKRKFGGAAGGGKRRKRPDTPSSPFITPSDPPTRPLSVLSGSPVPFDSAVSSIPGTNGASTPTASSAQALTHHGPHAKLGPKANQGSINAQLRALDRTGRPCRRWAKIPLEMQSFTGWEWSVATWYGGSTEEVQAQNMNEVNDQDDRKLDTSSTSTETNKDDSKSTIPSAPPAPPPLTITIPSLSTVSGRSKDSAKVDEPHKKGPRRFPAILLRQSLDEFEV